GVTPCLGRGIQYADGPINLFPRPATPGAARGPALSGHIMGEEGRFAHPGKHSITVPPGIHGKETGRLTEAVSDHRLWLNAKTPDNIAHGAASCNLAEDNRLGIAIHLGKEAAVPEEFRLELAAQMEILHVSAPK